MSSVAFEVRETSRAPRPDRPFSAVFDVEKAVFVLHLPWKSQVWVRSGLVWKTLVDRTQWREQGVLAGDESHPLVLTVACDRKIRLRIGTRYWTMGLRREREAFSFRPLVQTTLALFRSAFLHGAALAVLLGILYLPKLFPHGKQIEAKPELAQSTMTYSVKQVVPFTGATYAEFIKQTTAPEQNVNRLLSKLQKYDSGALKTQSGSGLGLGGFAMRNQAKEVALNTAVVAETTKKEAPAKALVLTADQQNLVRRKFQEFEREFERVLKRALKHDPDLSVTVTYEIQVRPNGFLGFNRLDTRGRYKKEGLETLKKGLTETVEAAFVGEGLAGTLIRGESIFVARGERS